MYIDIYIYIYIFIYKYIYAYIYMNIYLYIYIDTLTQNKVYLCLFDKTCGYQPYIFSYGQHLEFLSGLKYFFIYIFLLVLQYSLIFLF